MVDAQNEGSQYRLEIIREPDALLRQNGRLTLPGSASRSGRFSGTAEHVVFEPSRLRVPPHGLAIALRPLDVRLIEPMDPMLVPHREEHPVLEPANRRDALPQSPRDVGTCQRAHA
jgi:hypothetical protein